MEEEVTYSTVVFKDFPPPPKEKKEEPIIYSEVKAKAAAASVPDGEAAAHSHLRVLAACLGILCVLLVGSISAIIYIRGVMKEEKVNLRNLKAENQQLITEKSILERETEELSRVADNLNWTLGVILKFNTFPVKEYCPERKCQPCQKNWIPFQKKCYRFSTDKDRWQTWRNSRKYCKDATADLVVIDSLQEQICRGYDLQEFINNHTAYYYDRFHGYWIGLYETEEKNWVWVDGHNDTLSYWMPKPLGNSGPVALMIPDRNSTASWDPADPWMANKFICESDALIRSN